jgi:transcriptional regulator of arginine metabolism
MQMKIERLKTIKKIIRENRIGSQELLLDCLAEKGITVTQATLSRDLKFLKVGKVPDTAGGFYYRLPEAEAMKETKDGFYRDLQRASISIGFSGNLGVMHTMPGHANSAAFALDNLEFDEILGTIAGDDTILLILQEHADKEILTASLRRIVPDLEVLT